MMRVKRVETHELCCTLNRSTWKCSDVYHYLALIALEGDSAGTRHKAADAIPPLRLKGGDVEWQ